MPVPPSPAIRHAHGLAQPDIHVGIAKQDVALDEQLLGEAPAQSSVEEFRSLAQQIVAYPDGIKGDVRRHDVRGPAGGVQEFRATNELEGFRPSVDAARVTCLVGFHYRPLECLQRQSQHGRAGVLLAARLGASRINAVCPPRIQYAPVLHHAAFGEHHDLASPEDLFGKKRQEIGKILRHRANANQVVGKGIAFDEEFPGGDGPAVGATFHVDEVLGNEGFEAGEMIEQEDVTVGDLGVPVMQLEVYR